MGFSAKKAAKSTDKALAGLDSQIKAGNAARTAQADADMADIRKDMAAKTAARVASKAAPQKQSFAEAFRAARARAKAEGRDPSKEVFTWGGQKKVARLVGEGASKPAARAAKPQQASTSAPAKPSTSAPASPSKSMTPVRTPSAGGPGSLFLDKPEYRAARERAPNTTPSAPTASAKPGVDPRAAALARASAARAAARAAMAKRNAPAEPKPDVWAPGAKPSGGRLLLKDNDYKKGGAAKKPAAKQPVKKFAKGGSVDGCAVRGKTRAPLRKK